MGTQSSSTEPSIWFDGISSMNTVSTNSSTTFPTEPSDLYMACKEGRLEDSEHLLKTASLEDINRMELLGSTALHAAAYHGHEKIVKLLLGKGALRTTRNKYGLTPFEEATTPEVKKLFERASHTKRFGGLSGSIEWNVIDPTAAKSVSEYKETEKNWFTDVCSNDSALYLKEIERYVHKKLADIEGIDEVFHLIDQAIKDKNILLTLKIYTLQTGFYSALNIELASNNSATFIENDAQTYDEYFRYWHGPGGYAALIAHHPEFKEYSFLGTAFRGMLLLDTDIIVYKVNTFVINKAFLSTSIDRQIAKSFIESPSASDKTTDNVVRYPAICTYKIRNHGTAFNISSISEYPQEQEVLIMPRTAFRVVSIQKKRSIIRSLTILIELHECDPEKFVDTSGSINTEDPY